MKNEKTTTKPAFDPEVPPREGFIFYRTFYEALASMKNRARLHLYDVIMRYALYGEEPTDLNGEQMRTFILIPSCMLSPPDKPPSVPGASR